jgi:hypothetical protein
MKPISRKVTYAIAALFFITTGAVLFVNHTLQDMREDAIQDATFLSEMIDLQPEEPLQELALSAVADQNKRLAPFGGKIQEPHVFFEAVMGDILRDMRNEIRAKIKHMYLTTFTVTELHNIATFFESEAGRKFNDLTTSQAKPVSMTDDEYLKLATETLSPEHFKTAITFLESESAKAYLTIEPKLIAIASSSAKASRPRIQRAFEFSNLAALYEREDLVTFETPTQRAAVVEGLQALAAKLTPQTSSNLTRRSTPPEALR